jgi:phosphohistidine phosphatase SixA
MVLGLFAFVPATAAIAQDGPSLVILVRHAEKAAVPGNDPPLSEAGMARAKALAVALANTPVTAIVTTNYARTFETASVVAQERKLTAEKIGIEGGMAAHVAAVAAAVRAKKGVVLVVGHSNTIPAIATALGAPKMTDICDAHYGRMFILLPMGSGTPSLTLANYGAADPESAPVCAGMSR